MNYFNVRLRAAVHAVFSRSVVCGKREMNWHGTPLLQVFQSYGRCLTVRSSTGCGKLTHHDWNTCKKKGVLDGHTVIRVYIYCFHRSTSSLMYHLTGKHTADAESPPSPSRLKQTTLDGLSRRHNCAVFYIHVSGMKMWCLYRTQWRSCQQHQNENVMFV